MPKHRNRADRHSGPSISPYRKPSVQASITDDAEVLELSDNLYSLWRRTCTGHVLCKSLHRAPGALGQDIIKIINQSTNFINELLYMHFVTVISPVRRHKKLFSYYLII